ncbi:uncharacterized protein LOC131693016 [Topomyia yanbarensis]|uniref:uncharacterized protein LOC131693016 n=1 Tax=Topomyia yanbarensis TaxID=2498891 RepID=UPI00273AF85F|nr:uncharacterized protein LOC131693016 [Topomyia yanbarensis]
MSTHSLVRPGLTTSIIGHLPAIKLRLRKKVPLLTFQDVRRARIPFYEALASELYETGCVNAAFLLLQLIEYEHDQVPQTSDPSIEEKRLKNSKKELNYLFKFLYETEGHKMKEQYENEVENLLAIGRSFQDDKLKRWVTRQFFLVSLDRCKDCCLESTRVGALANYYYGMFLLNEGNLEEAASVLESAKEQAAGQTWPLFKQIGSALLSNEIYQQLFLVYSKLAEQFGKTNTAKFEKYMRLSHAAAVNSNIDYVLCDSYLHFGDFLLDRGEYREALSCYKQSSKMAKSIFAADKVCKTNIRMAAVHRRLDEPKECVHLLQMVDRLTAHDRTSECYAEMQLLNGEIHLENDRLPEAIHALNTSREAYKHLKKEDKMIQASCFGALAAGETHFGLFAELVLKAEYRGRISDNDSLFKVLRWNENSEPFW